MVLSTSSVVAPLLLRLEWGCRCSEGRDELLQDLEEHCVHGTLVSAHGPASFDPGSAHLRREPQRGVSTAPRLAAGASCQAGRSSSACSLSRPSWQSRRCACGARCAILSRRTQSESAGETWRVAKSSGRASLEATYRPWCLNASPKLWVRNSAWRVHSRKRARAGRSSAAEVSPPPPLGLRASTCVNSERNSTEAWAAGVLNSFRVSCWTLQIHLKALENSQALLQPATHFAGFKPFRVCSSRSSRNKMP